MTAARWLRALVSTWRGRFIAAFVVIQLALPLHYYVARRDRHDERFAWRMFSPMRMMTCSDPDDRDLPPRFVVAGERISLYGSFHEAWVEIARRGRYAVIEKMLAQLCAKYPGKEVRFAMTCTHLDGTEERIAPPWNMCAVEEL